MADRTPDELRADMSRTLLVQMAASADPQTREHATVALTAQGLGLNGQPTQPATAPAPNAPPAPQYTLPQSPAQTPAAPAQPPASPATGPSDAALEGLRDANGLILGKYRTVDELKRGYFNAVNALSATTDEVVRLRNQPVGVNPQSATLPGGAPGDVARVNPAQRAYDPSQDIAELVKSSEESGQIDPALLAQTVSRIASRTAMEATEAQLRPMQAMAEAESYMRVKYPESINHAQELGNFVKLDPNVASTVQALMTAGQFKSAFEYAWSMYTVQNGLSVERGMIANSQIAEEERQRARAAAGFSGSPNTGVHTDTKPAPPTAEEMAALNERAKYDQGAQIVRRRVLLGQFLPESWRTWENPEHQQ